MLTSYKLAMERLQVFKFWWQIVTNVVLLQCSEATLGYTFRLHMNHPSVPCSVSGKTRCLLPMLLTCGQCRYHCSMFRGLRRHYHCRLFFCCFFHMYQHLLHIYILYNYVTPPIPSTDHCMVQATNPWHCIKRSVGGEAVISLGSRELRSPFI